MAQFHNLSRLDTTNTGDYDCCMEKLQDAEAKQKLLDLARELLITSEYNKTSIESLCHQAGVSKDGFYHHFPSKEALAMEAVELFWASRKRLLDNLRKKERNPLKRVMIHLKFVCSFPRIERNDIGCLMAVLGKEMSLINTHCKNCWKINS